MTYNSNGRSTLSQETGLTLDQSLEKRLNRRVVDSLSDISDEYHNKEKVSELPITSEIKGVFFADLRILPVVIILACLLLAIKIPNFFISLKDTWYNTQVVAVAEAQETKNLGDDKSKPIAGQSKKIANKSLNKKEVLLDPVLFTRSEIELLQELSKRRKELDGREGAIVQREGLLMAAENRLEVKINELEGIKTDIETLITKYNAQEEEKFKGLVAIYEKMKAKDSARIFDELDIEILLELFERMKASKSASILAQMKAVRAKEITSRIADRREMPKLGLKK
jgi:flagellar motility protein MotE (MotC chaperone)